MVSNLMRMMMLAAAIPPASSVTLDRELLLGERKGWAQEEAEARARGGKPKRRKKKVSR